jgi:hypothetical protein
MGMGIEDEHFRPSGTRIVTEADERARIKLSLQEARGQLARISPTPTTRRLELALELFRSTVETWDEQPPTDEELDLIRDHIAEAQMVARRNMPTVKLRRSA